MSFFRYFKSGFKASPFCVRITAAVLTAAGILVPLSLMPSLLMGVKNTGTYAGMAIGIFTTAVGLLMPNMLCVKKGAVRGFYIAFLSIFALMFIYAVVLSAAMLSKMITASEASGKTIVVLGCQVNDKGPSLMLKGRLDTAYELLRNDDTLMCVVSGGKGETEPMSQAEAMESYLVGKGIDGSRIFKESRSSSTKENLEFTKQIIDENGLSDEIIIVTDGFHELRSLLLAKKLGYEEIGCRAAETPLFLLSAYWIREWLALSYYFVFGIG